MQLNWPNIPSVLLLMLALSGLVLIGCAGPQRADDPYMPERVDARDAVPDYDELVQRYNANLEHLDRLWSRSVAAMRWTDENDRRRYEQGEGHFIFMAPARIALTLGKHRTLLWAGADDERYWMFDLRDQGVVNHGLHANLGRPCSRELPLPLQPRAVPHLLGLLPLADSSEEPNGEAPTVERVRGYDVIEPPGTALRLMLHPDTALPARVDMLDRAGEPAVIALLEQHEHMEVEGVARMASPRIATRATVYAVGEDAELSLTLSGLTDGRRFDRIDDRVFDFEFLQQRHTPREIVDLDAACP